MPFAIHEPEYRSRLEVRAKPYYVRLTDCLYLGYRKGKSLTRWVVRERHKGRYRTQTLAEVEPDDNLSPDGVRILSFQQVVDRIMKENEKSISCSFCGKDPTQVEKLVAGPGVFICDKCVAMCQLYIEHDQEGVKLLVKDGAPVFENGEPVFVPLSEEERKLQTELRNR